MQRASGTEGYAESADALARQYESISFAEVHHDILHLMPEAPSRILDIGAGTGRDAAAFAAQGHSVVAVEPTAALRAHGQRLHPSPRIAWVDDSLPALATVHARFDVIMATAVWMHLDADQRAQAMQRAAGLLHPGGLLALTLRHGPVPEGRRMFEVSAAETCALAHEAGLKTVHESKRDGMFGRKAVWWSVLAFRSRLV